MSLTAAKPALIADLKKIFEDEANAVDSPADSRQKIAQKMADAIEKFVKAGAVATTGTATAQTGTIS